MWEYDLGERAIMDIGYKNGETRRVCTDEAFAKQQYSPKVVSNIKKLIIQFMAIDTFDRFRNNPMNKKYNIHNLKGENKFLISLRLDYSYRMTVKLEVENNKIIIWEISKHYGD